MPAIIVFAATMPMRPSAPASELPALNPNQPKARMKVPSLHHRDVVRQDRVDLAVLAVLADARPDQARGDERERAALQVDDAGAGVVDRAVSEPQPVPELREPAAAPDPAAEDRVDERADEDAEDEEALEASSARRTRR